MISRLLLTEVTPAAGHPRAGRPCPVFAYLIHHPDGLVLVDTGVGVAHPWIDEHLAPVHHPLDDALARAGAAGDDVAVVINSHLHFDHCGQNRLFPGATLVAQRIEYDAAQQAGYTVPEWADFPGARWELVDGKAEVLPGVRVLPTPGHTAGHQSVVVAGKDGVDVIAAQAIYDPDELITGTSAEPLSPEDAATTAASAAAIRDLRPHRVWFSHDARVWER